MDQNLFSLDWDKHHKTILRNLNEQRLQNQFCDVTLAAGGKLFNAHKNVLAACSSYFHKMFSHMPEGKQGFVYLKGVSWLALQHLLQFVYNGQVQVKFDDLPDLVSLGKELHIKGLAKNNTRKSKTASRPKTKVSQTTSVPASCPNNLRITECYSVPSIDDSEQKQSKESPIVASSASLTAEEPQVSREMEPTKIFPLTSENVEKFNALILESNNPALKRFYSPLSPNPQASSPKRQKLSNEAERDESDEDEAENIDHEIKDELSIGKEEIVEGYATEDDNNAGPSAETEATMLMCIMSLQKKPILVHEDFLYYYHNPRKHWKCGNGKTYCKAKLLFKNGIPEVQGEHNHRNEKERIDRSNLIPFHQDFMKLFNPFNKETTR